MRAQSFLAAALIIVVLPLLTIPKQADAADKMIYWSDSTCISRANLDGTGSQQLVAVEYGANSWGLSIDSTAGKMYWAESYDGGLGKIRRSSLDGSHIEDVLTGLTGPEAITLDALAGRMYWKDAYGIKWANLDGSNVTSIANEENFATGIAVDPIAGKVYWSEYENGIIRRSNLDGSQIEDVLSSVYHSWDMALDTTAGKIYWTEERDGSSIGWANLDGSNMQYVRVGDLGSFGIALDTDAGKMYFSRALVSSELDVSIQRANLDGSGIESVVSDVMASSIAIGPVPEPATLLLLGFGAAVLRKKAEIEVRC